MTGRKQMPSIRAIQKAAAPGNGNGPSTGSSISCSATLPFAFVSRTFGHLGLFPEHAQTWGWLKERIRARLADREMNVQVLNLFAYTGGSTLAASQAGAHVVHVDAAKGVVDWARENARLSHLDSRPIRWIVDDALKFVQREVRRGNRYHGIILDPPSFGRGPKGQVFKIEDDVLPLLEACSQLLGRDAVVPALHLPYAGLHAPRAPQSA